MEEDRDDEQQPRDEEGFQGVGHHARSEVGGAEGREPEERIEPVVHAAAGPVDEGDQDQDADEHQDGRRRQARQPDLGVADHERSFDVPPPVASRQQHRGDDRHEPDGPQGHAHDIEALVALRRSVCQPTGHRQHRHHDDDLQAERIAP